MEIHGKYDKQEIEKHRGNQEIHEIHGKQGIRKIREHQEVGDFHDITVFQVDSCQFKPMLPEIECMDLHVI